VTIRVEVGDSKPVGKVVNFKRLYDKICVPIVLISYIKGCREF